jgi:hypothetical protein
MSVAESKKSGPRNRIKLMKRHKGNLEKWMKNPTNGFPWMVAANILLLLANDYICRQLLRTKEES